MLPRLQAEETLRLSQAAWLATSSQSEEQADAKKQELERLQEQAEIEESAGMKLTPWQEFGMLASRGVNISFVPQVLPPPTEAATGDNQTPSIPPD